MPDTTAAAPHVYVTASSTILEQVLLGNFMDVLKVEKQRTLKPYPTLARHVCRNGVVRGTLTGLWPWGLGMYGVRGAVFGMGYSTARGYFPEQHQHLGGSAVGGLLEGALTSPLSMMRTRAMQNHAGESTALPTLAQVLRPVPINSVKRAIDWSTRSVLYAAMPVAGSASAFLAGGLSALITAPIDRVIPIIQQHGAPHKILGWWTDQLRAKGMRHIMAGTTARVVHCAWNTMFVFGALDLSQVYFSSARRSEQ